MNEKCNAPGCENEASQFLIWRPGELAVLDGGLSVTACCGVHPAVVRQQQVARADPGAVFWTVYRGDGQPLAPGAYHVASTA